MFHELLLSDYVRKITYCNWFNDNMIMMKYDNDEILNKAFFTDEARFHPTLYVL